MAYALLTTNYGTSFANAPALLLDSVTGQPATILSSATGGLVNDQGKATLDSNGVLSVYVDTARTWTVTLTDKTPSYRNLVTAEFEPGSTTPALKAGGVEVFSGSQVGGIRGVVSRDGNLTATTYDGSGRVSGYTLGGVEYVVAYPNATTVAVTGGGRVVTVTLDGSGRVVGKAVA